MARRLFALILLVGSADALRVGASMSRRSVIAASAGSAILGIVPQQSHAETIADVVRALGNGEANADEYWAANPPRLSPVPKLTTMTSFALDFTVAESSGVEYLWMKRVRGPDAPKDLPASVISPSKVKPGTAGIKFFIPLGSYSACAWSPTHGLYESKPFTIGANPDAQR
jgi:hypothetical protein